MARTRRAELLNLAATLVSERGYRAVGMDDIGEAAGISGPALYKHFRGKQQLLGEMLIEPTDRLDQGARKVVAEAETPEDALDALVEWHLEFTSQGVNVTRLYYGCLDEMAPADRANLERKLDAYIELWVKEIRRVRPDITPATSRTAVMTLFRMFNMPHEERPRSASKDHVVKRMAISALHGLLSGPPTKGGSRAG
jgi:AcrR family transcriptional regulator